MSKKFQILILFVTFYYEVSATELDIVVVPRQFYNWTTTYFIISGTHEGKEWQTCNKFSSVYCLWSYDVSLNDLYDPSFSGFGILRQNFWHALYWLNQFVRKECETFFHPTYLKHNHFVDDDGCCESQYHGYFTKGFLTLNLTPKEYFEKMTNYDENHKQLNLIGSYFQPECGVNIITLVGFGDGKLRRFNHHEKRPLIGAPYQLKVSSSWTAKIPYENPEQFLTFRWFKYNVMCLDQPWICD